ARGGWNSVEVEDAELFIITRQWALALEHLNLHAWLIVAVSREDLRFSRRNGGVPRNHRCSHAAGRFDRKRKRCNIEKEHIFDVALQNAALNASADRDHFVRVHPLVRFLADKVACNLLYL